VTPCMYTGCINVVYSRSVGELQANALGVVNQLARIMQQPNLGMLGCVLCFKLYLYCFAIDPNG